MSELLVQILIWGVSGIALYAIGFMIWVEIQTRGDGYFARPLAERQAFVKMLQKHAVFMRPPLEFLSRVFRLPKIPVMRYQGVTGPLMMCSKKSYAATLNYMPGSEDIFIATQMKCGTTWMQQIVFEILHGGEGDLSDDGYRHMYALSPWIETSPTSSVPMERAPLVGPKKNRIIKTHMPAQLIPDNDGAKYIYVTRHPVSCFASCVDFINLLGGPMIPDRKHLLDWYCSEDMWWMSWPDHVESWWKRSQQHDNVLFVHYEELKQDLPGMITKIAEFLNTPLSDDEHKKVVHKAGFEYMKEHEYYFEMFAPNVFSVSNDIRFMQSGALNRHEDTDAIERERINEFCRERLANASYPLAAYYPDVLNIDSSKQKKEKVSL